MLKRKDDEHESGEWLNSNLAYSMLFSSEGKNCSFRDIYLTDLIKFHICLASRSNFGRLELLRVCFAKWWIQGEMQRWLATILVRGPLGLFWFLCHHNEGRFAQHWPRMIRKQCPSTSHQLVLPTESTSTSNLFSPVCFLLVLDTTSRVTSRAQSADKVFAFTSTVRSRERQFDFIRSPGSKKSFIM